MHEYSVTKNILDIALEEAGKAGARKITGINLVIGSMSSFAEESVRMFFDEMSKGTPAEGAELVFTKVPACFKCSVCGTAFTDNTSGFDCPSCGSPGFLDDPAYDLYIDSLEAEE
jgi:hydrogenase nickel incorporation protein HypA/HybF